MNNYIVRYIHRTIERVGTEYDLDTFDCVFANFEEAQGYLLQILKADHANAVAQHIQAIADISRLSIEMTAIEAKIRIVNTSSEQDYIV